MSDQQPVNPMRLSPGMARVNKGASGCMFWLTLIPLILFALVVLAVVAAFVLG